MRITFNGRLLLLALLLLSGWACSETLVGVVDIAAVEIDPPAASVYTNENVSLQARVKDDRGNILTGRRLDWASEDPDVATVDSQGRVRGVSAGVTDIVATSEGVRSTARITVRDRPAPADIAIAGGNNQSAEAGTAVNSPLRVLVTDEDQNPVQGAAVTFAVASGGGSLASGGPVLTDGSGIAASPAWTLGSAVGTNTVTATVAGLPGEAVTFTATATQGPPSQLSIATQPSASAQNGAVFTRQPVIQLRDPAGNAVGQAGVAVSVAIATGGGTLNGTRTVNTDAAGRAAFTNLAITGAAGDRTLEFTAAGFSSVTSTTIAITASAGTALGITTQPSTTAPNGAVFARQPVLQLQDAGGNAVAQAGILITASIQSGGGTLGGTKTATTNAAGTATFADLSMTGTVGDRTLRFAASGITAVTSNTIALTVGPGSAAQSSASVPSGTAGNPTPITITVKDVGGNAVTGEAARLSVSVTGANTAAPSVTETGGGSYSATYTPASAGTDQVAITLGGTAIAGSPYSSTVTPLGVSDANSSVSASPARSLVANGQDAATITVVLRDGLDNPVTGLAGSIQVALSGSASTGSVAETSTAGTYVFSVTSTVANLVGVAVTVSGITLSDKPTLDFVAGPIDGAVSSVGASPSAGLAADGAAASTVTVTLADAFDNPVTGLTDADFSVALTGSAQRTPVNESGTAGTYTFSVTNTVAETVTVTVTAGGVQLTQRPTIQFIASGVSGTLSTAVANPTTGVTANGSAASTVTVQLVDDSSNPVAGLTNNDFTIGLTGSAQASSVTATGTAGTYAFTVTNTDVEVVTVTVTAGGVALAQKPTIAFVAGPISATVSTATASPSASVRSDGVDASTVTVTLMDANSNPIGGLSDSDFNINLTGGAQRSSVTETSTPGTYTFSVTNTSVGLITVTVTAGGVQLAQKPTIRFIGGSVSGSLSTATVQPASGVTADGITSSTLTVTLVDDDGSPVTGANSADFVISVTGSAAVTGFTATATPGTYTFVLTDTVAELGRVTVIARSVQLQQQPTVQFVAGPVDPANSSVVAVPTQVVVN